jgi:hypothetical protein
MMVAASEPTIEPALSLSPDQAYVLAELAKRIGWSDVRRCSIDDDEAHQMLAAMEHVRTALAASGVRVR